MENSASSSNHSFADKEEGLFPKAVLSVNREEYGQGSDKDPLRLNILKRKDKLEIDASQADFLIANNWVSESLPEDLEGHVFIVGPAGSLESKGQGNIVVPTFDGWTHLFFGDGMIYRLDFHHSGQVDDNSDKNSENYIEDKKLAKGDAFLSTKLIKTPDYYVDKALLPGGDYDPRSINSKNSHSSENLPWSRVEYRESKFYDSVITRLSFRLGGRNLLNTALLPMKPNNKPAKERLLLVWDAGRPYEINPYTLDLVGPVGFNKDWQPLIEINQLSRFFRALHQGLRRDPCLRQILPKRDIPLLTQVFPITLAVAHPVYAPDKDIVYVVNATKSLPTMLSIPRTLPNFKRGIFEAFENNSLPKWIYKILPCSDQESLPKLIQYILWLFIRFIISIVNFIINLLSYSEKDGKKLGGEDHLYLYRWDGKGARIRDTDKWEVVNSRGCPIKIPHSLHQMGITRDYIILSDSSFKLVLADVIPSIFNPPYFLETFQKIPDTLKKVSEFSRQVPEFLKQIPDLPNAVQKLAKQVQEFPKQVQEFPNASSKVLWMRFLLDSSSRERFFRNPGISLTRSLLRYVNYPQSSYTDIYVIDRPDRLEDKNSAPSSIYEKIGKASESRQTIHARHFRIEPETAHFVTNYENPEGKITLHVAHTAAHDPAEFIHKIDEALCGYRAKDSTVISNCNKEVSEQLQERAGIGPSGMDNCRLGTWVLDIENYTTRTKERLIEKDFLEDKYNDKLWSTALYTWHEKFSDNITDVYWNCWGAWPNTLAEYYFELYKNRQDNIPELFKNIVKTGKQPNLLHIKQFLEDGKPKVEIVDSYIFPRGFFANSPQFAPRDFHSSDSSPTNGYIICLVIATNHSYTEPEDREDKKLCEFWIFDAQNLEQGPLYRLSHPQMNIGVTIHTAWLSELNSPPKREDDYSVEKDYEEKLEKIEPSSYKVKVKDLFKRDVYPHFK